MTTFEIHRAVSIDDAVSLGVRHDEPESYLAESLGVPALIDDPAISAFVAEAFDEYRQLLREPGIPSFLYNDLHGDNMGFDVAAGRLNGIFDFGDIAIGDLHREFGPLYRLDRRLLEATVHAYQALTGLALSLRRIVVIQRMDRISDYAMLADDPSDPELERVLVELREWVREP